MYAEIIEKLNLVLESQDKIMNMFVNKNSLSQTDQWLDNADVKRLLKISDSSLYRLRKDKLLKAKMIGGKWFYELAMLKQLIHVK